PILTGEPFVRLQRIIPGACLALVALSASPLLAQGPAPETAPPLFPGGALFSYNSIITTRSAAMTSAIPSTAFPTFSHEADFNFTWGFRRDFDMTVIVPLVTNRFNGVAPTAGGTGLGDAMLLVKYRFYRRDNRRGTTQASVTLGPKIPTGTTDLADMTGKRLPVGLQPGSGSADLFGSVNYTYTGLFNLRRLVADEDFHFLLRSEGSQATRLGSNAESRFWLSYRPYEAKDGSHEWFIGPVLTWLHNSDEKIFGTSQPGSGGDALLAGMTSYLGVRPGVHLWLAVDWDVAHSAATTFMPVRRHISFGVTQQFRLHL
ncbi:MAG: hypothetical protein ACREIC_00095, partial [Limisphaerales bacterium]